MTDMHRSGTGDRDLVEPEGVNAGSSDPLADDGAPPRDVRSGGDPEHAPERVPGSAAEPADAEPLLGPAGEDPPAPGQQLAVGEG